MAAIQVVKDPADSSKALISWTLPFNNFETLTILEIQILQKDGIFSSHSGCVPTSSDTSCSISIASLRTSPYSLVQGDLIQGRI